MAEVELPQQVPMVESLALDQVEQVEQAQLLLFQLHQQLMVVEAVAVQDLVELGVLEELVAVEMVDVMQLAVMEPLILEVELEVEVILLEQ